jgi:KDO2-lipid IV(A) lauroyltransferase
MAKRNILREPIYFVQASALAMFLLFCRLMPVDWASAMGGWIGRTIGPHLGQSRKAVRNLTRAIPENSPAENQRIIRGMWDNLGRVIAEFPHLPNICHTMEGGRVEVLGFEHIQDMAKDRKAGILFGAHLGNWEVPSFVARHFGLDISLVYRAPNNQYADRILHRLRDSQLLIPKGRDGARALIALLRQGGHAAMLVDQKMNDGIAVPFFGRDAMTAPAIAQFGFRLGCVIVPFRTERLKGAHFRITVFPPMELISTGDRAADEHAVMARINALVEGWIRAAPEQWLWLHRRWPD